MSLRKAINLHCKSCIYDEMAMGTWKQQVTLCSVGNCELFDVRPTTDRIPESVLKYYGVESKEALNKELDKFEVERRQKLANFEVASECPNEEKDPSDPTDDSDVGC